MNSQVFVTKSSEESQIKAEELGKTLLGSSILALYGDLGAGKTTFVQGLAKGLGITERIISPTFVLVRSHEIKNKESKIKNFYHIDLYRLEKMQDIKNLGIEEMVNEKSIVAIEWAEKMKDLLPKKRIDVRFKHLEGNKREIKIVRYE